MKILCLTILLLSLLGCSPSEPETSIEGIWRSDREMTISHFTDNEKLTAEIKVFLAVYLGDLHLSFKGTESKIFFLDIPESEMDSHSFQIIEQTPDLIMIEFYERFLFMKYSLHAVTYHFTEQKNCIYLTSEEYGYNEYFCKLDQMVEP